MQNRFNTPGQFPTRAAMDAAIAAAVAAAETSSPAASLGALGATEVISIANGELQDGVLDSNCEITLENAPSSATHWRLLLRLTQNATGGYLPSFKLANGDNLKWANNEIPSANNFHVQPNQTNLIEFIGANDVITAQFVNPKGDYQSFVGGSFIQQLIWNFLGNQAISKRLPFNLVANEVTTTDATLTTVTSIPVYRGETAIALTLVIGSRSTGAESITAAMIAGYRRGTTGNVAETAAETIFSSLEDSSGTPAISSAVDTTNNFGLIQVTGEGSKTFNWAAYTFYFKVTV